MREEVEDVKSFHNEIVEQYCNTAMDLCWTLKHDVEDIRDAKGNTISLDPQFVDHVLKQFATLTRLLTRLIAHDKD